MDRLGDTLKKRKDFDIDQAFTEKDQLADLSARLHRRAEKYQDLAKGDLEALQVEVVLLLICCLVHALCMEKSFVRNSILQDTVQTTMQVNMHQTGKILDLVSFQRQSFMARKQKYVEIRDQSCHAISSGFRSKLKTGRNWKGHVHVDHDMATVVLSVTPNKGT